jgi:hypothetical protein
MTYTVIMDNFKINLINYGLDNVRSGIYSFIKLYIYCTGWVKKNWYIWYSNE